MSASNIVNNDTAMAILREVADALNAIGVACMLAPMALPEAMSVSLHSCHDLAGAGGAYVAAAQCGE